MPRKLIVELIGTFFLVFTVGMTAIGRTDFGAALAPIAIGGVLMVMVYAGGHISGGHYNPAVTLAVWLRGKAAAAEVVPYWIAQLAGGALAALAAGYLRSGPPLSGSAPATLPALLAEILFTFALAFVVLNVATARGTEGNSNYGLAIGFTVTAGAYAVGGVSGAAFNPAVATGLTVMGALPLGAIWIYLVANLGGAAAAALLFNALDLGDDRPLHVEPARQGEISTPASTGGAPTDVR